MKVCKRCGKRKPLTAYDKAARCAQGRRGTCRHCRDGARGEGPAQAPPRRFRRSLSARRYIITAAQNATPVHAEFLATLKVAAAHLAAELVVIPLRYRNPTSLWTKGQESDEWWAPEVVPFLFNGRKKLGPNLVLAADVKTQPTASAPLMGFESLTGAESCIIGHPKMQFRTVPVPSGRFPKILTTTGACTRKNYSDTKAGKIAAFHHYMGALVVELEGPRFHLRQLNAAADGSFTDLDLHFTREGVVPAPPALALVMGDTHVRVTDPDVDRATFGPGGIVETLNPRTLVFHDLVDGETTNPHEVGNPFIAEAKRRAGRLDVRAELEEMVAFVNARAGGREAVIVDSNHHDFLARWIIRTDWRQAGGNAEFYLQTALATLQSSRMEKNGAAYDDPFHYWVRMMGGNVRCLRADESFTVAGIECGMHGHQGPGGARGSLKNLSRLGARVITGHRHAPGIEEGHVQVGTSSYRRLPYQHGPDCSLNTHCVVYATGKRALLTIIGDAWRLAA